MKSHITNRKLPNKPRFHFEARSQRLSRKQKLIKHVKDSYPVLLTLLGIFLAAQGNKMNSRMLDLAEKQENTATEVARFNELLEKVSLLLASDSLQNVYLAVQLDTSTEIRRRMGKVFNTILDQRNFDAVLENRKTLNELKDKSYKYNELTLLFSDLEPVLYRYTAMKAGQSVLPIFDINQRIDNLNTVQNILRGMFNIHETVESKSVSDQFSAALTNVTNLKNRYVRYLYYGITTDTTKAGTLEYETTMSSVSDLRDSVYFNIELARNKNAKKLEKISSTNRKNLEDLSKRGLLEVDY